MANYVAICPYCKTHKNVSQNMGYTCSGCGATVVIGNDGKIKSTKPKK